MQQDKKQMDLQALLVHSFASQDQDLTGYVELESGTSICVQVSTF